MSNIFHDPITLLGTISLIVLAIRFGIYANHDIDVRRRLRPCGPWEIQRQCLPRKLLIAGFRSHIGADALRRLWVWLTRKRGH